MEEDSEGNGLVYPKIENVFSKVTNIKSEPVDYEYESIELAEYDSNEYHIPIPNKIILGSKPKVSNEPVAETSTAETWQEFPCDECDAVLLTQIDLDTHKQSHSFLVARSMSVNTTQSISSCFIETPEAPKRQRAKKSTAKSSILNNTFPLTNAAKANITVPADEYNLLCNHCDVTFPDEDALMTHKYELLPEKTNICDICQQGFNTVLGLRGHRAVHFRKRRFKAPVPVVGCTTEFLQCPTCTCYFKYPGGILKHMSKFHATVHKKSKPVPFSNKCAYCEKVIGTPRQYNMHILKIHSKMFIYKGQLPVLPKMCVKFKCTLCKQAFATRYAAKKHKALKHPNHKKKTTLETIKNTSLTKNPSLIGAPIPKQTLFKCNNCQIHFVTCSTAVEHSKRCVLAKGDWKCVKCRRTFTHMERPIHTMQHEHSDKFKVHIVDDKIISKVICCCPKCKLHFDENAFWKHVSAGCTEVNGVECNTCNLNMHPDSVSKHRKYHDKDGLSRSDYIIIEFVDAALQGSSPALEGERKLYYCKTCKCNSYTLKNKTFHLSAVCKEKSYTRNCLKCGLLFSNKVYPKHMLDHSEKNLTLDDYTFVRIHDDRVINAPLPEFMKCDECKIRFITSTALKVHDCKTQKYTKCAKCSHKYEQYAYDVHLPFHQYRSSGDEDKVAPTKLYIYACVACNYGFNSYDSLVEHCQHHYNDTHVLKTTACRFCRLNYHGDHFVNHRDIKILKFDHDKLLKNDFLVDGFQSVSREEVEYILSQSMYGKIRNVRNIRLQLVGEGPPKRSLYKCAQCELCFDMKNVLEHTKEPCSRTPRYKCNSCTAEFPTQTTALIHNNIHVIFGDEITFREILFNDQSDKDLNEALRTGRKKESLKFRKCQHCSTWIKENDFQTHMEEHEKKQKVKRQRYTIFPQSGHRKMYTVYRCVHCTADLMKRVNVARHKCSSRATSEKCSKCSLKIRKYFRLKHEKLHLNLPKFVTKNITVLKFEVHDDKYERDDAYETSTPSKTVQKSYDTRKSDRSYQDNPETESEDSQAETPNDSVSDAVNDLVGWKIEMTNKLYQCESCYMCFVSKDLLLDHIPKCVSLTEKPLSCASCDITLHPSLVAFHNKLHDLISQIPDENYLYLISLKLADDTDPWLYKCKPCDVHYLSPKALGYHFSKDHECVTSNVVCNTCNLQFTGHSHTKHKIYHDAKNGFSDQFNIEIVDRKVIQNGSIKVAKDVVSERDVTVDDVTETESQAANVSIDKDNNQTMEPNTSAYDEDEASNDENSSKQGPYDLYKCISCKVHYINRHTLLCHMRRNNRIHSTDSNQCHICNLEFGLYTMKKHKSIHHVNDKHNNFVVNTVMEKIFKDDDDDVCDSVALDEKENLFDTTQEMEDVVQDVTTQDEVNKDDVQNTERTVYASSVDTDDLPLVRPDNDVKKIKLYQCKDCRVCVERTQRNYHVCCSDIQKKCCISCSLAFKRTDFRSHIALHRKHRDLSRKNYVLVRFGRRSVRKKIFKCVPCSTHFVDMQSLQWHMDVYNHQTKRAYCETCGLFFGKLSLGRHVYIHHKKMKLTTEQLEIISVSNDTTSNNVATDSTQNTLDKTEVVKAIPQSKSFKKLFKCFECDVYFLTQSAYYKHMYNHVVLDPTEYIACKMCDIQFLTEDLGVHMKTHRDKTFNLNNLVIEGYQPRSELPRIESYLAVDGLNSKIVSTTTMSDIEEEKIEEKCPKNEEQLSTIDSTSAKLQ
ncbi:uncharacterized protein [Epargyreus clarus]|uniref:uncharacterized protein n=1 Tax=Epargyreus clarus TaxID=520877 RepID=UPI003C2B6D7E